MREKLNAIWECLAIGTIIVVVTGIVTLFTVPRHVVQYYMVGYDQKPRIIADIENGMDEGLTFSREITWQEAVHLCDSLNAQLKKYPIK